jgi:hypothetical protein
VALHLLELSVEQCNFFDEVIITTSQVTTVTVNLHAVANIIGVFDEDKDARLEESD